MLGFLRGLIKDEPGCRRIFGSNPNALFLWAARNGSDAQRSAVFGDEEMVRRAIDTYALQPDRVDIPDLLRRNGLTAVQAILPLKGKPLNVEKSNPAKVLSSEEITNIITAIGAGVGEQFDSEKIRYSRIIIMADADVDGEHIKTLLLTLFFRFMPKLIEEGHIYVALPPLYRIRKGQKDSYVYTDDELNKNLEKVGNATVTRFKGLGEMSPEQLWETTMNPKTRKIKKIFIDDALEADKTFSMLMGDDVQARKVFISENAKEANLDV